MADLFSLLSKVFLSAAGATFIGGALAALLTTPSSCGYFRDGVWVECKPGSNKELCELEAGAGGLTGPAPEVTVECSDPLVGSTGMAFFIGSVVCLALGALFAGLEKAARGSQAS